MNYEVVGTPRIESEYSDQFETVMSIDLRREDGQTGDVWIIAGVPDYHQGSATACGSQRGFETVRVFGDSPDMWCPAGFQVPDEKEEGDDERPRYRTISEEVIAAVEEVALRTHRDRMYAESNA